MKKTLLIMVLLGLFALVNGSVYAGNWSITDTNPGSPSNYATAVQDFKTSKNVVIQVNSTAQSYAAISGHSSGTNQYGVASDSTLVYYRNQSGSPTAAPGNADSSAFASGWSSM